MTRCIPDAWRRMRVIFIPKVGKENYDVPKAYRPITLSNYLLKGLERIIQWYIHSTFIQKPLFNQHAYTVGLSTDTALSEVVHYIEHGISQKQIVMAVSLDCTGAFDNIKFNSAKAALRSHGISNSIVDWYDYLLKSRILDLEFNKHKLQIQPTKGSPQGGILSPLVWNCIMDELLQTFRSNAVTAIGYADDIILLAKGIDQNSILSNVKRALHTVSQWGEAHGLTFNPSKTQAIYFTASAKKIQLKKILLYKSQTIEFQNSIKYLGLTIDRNLN